MRESILPGDAAANLRDKKMKVRHLLGTLVLTLVISVGFSSCEKETQTLSNPAQILPDPEGTITINMTNDGRTRIPLFPKPLNSDYYGDIYIDNANNFYGSGYGSIEFSALGSYNCFASAFQKALDNYPESMGGWGPRVAVIPGNAYWVRLNCYYHYSYNFIYVQDNLINTSGGIMGAIVKYLD